MASLATLARAQQSPKLADLDATWLQQLLDVATAAIERLSHRTFASGSVTEYQNGDGTRELLVDQYPLTAISQITVTDAGDTDTVYANTVFDFEGATGDIRFKPVEGGSFLPGFQNIKIEYTGGMASIPEDLQEATVQLVQWLAELNQSGIIESERMGDYMVKYSTSAARGESRGVPGWPKSVMALLTRFIDWGIGT